MILHRNTTQWAIRPLIHHLLCITCSIDGVSRLHVTVLVLSKAQHRPHTNDRFPKMLDFCHTESSIRTIWHGPTFWLPWWSYTDFRVPCTSILYIWHSVALSWKLMNLPSAYMLHRINGFAWIWCSGLRLRNLLLRTSSLIMRIR